MSLRSWTSVAHGAYNGVTLSAGAIKPWTAVKSIRYMLTYINGAE